MNVSSSIKLTARVFVPALALFALAAVGCSEAERTYDCAKICNKYSECFDEDLDKVACTDQCEDRGQEESDFADQASDCEACIDDQSCADATVDCTTVCAGVVAASTD